MEEHDTVLKITCQICNDFVTCKGRSRELLYTNFIHSGWSSFVIYTEEFDPKHFYFQWPSRKKTQRMYQNLLKEGNGYHKYLSCLDLQDNNFEVVRSKIAYNKISLSFAENV